MKLNPLEDRVIVIPDEPRKESDGGIIIPEQAQKKSQKGKVVAVGPGKILENGERSKMLLKKGDMVMFGAYAGTEFKEKGIDYIVMAENEVLAKMKE